MLLCGRQLEAFQVLSEPSSGFILIIRQLEALSVSFEPISGMTYLLGYAWAKFD
jgi:hypothetical protein